MFFERLNGKYQLILLVIFICIPLKLQAELIIENKEKLDYLVEGMEATLSKITITRATLNSIEILNRPGRTLCEIYNETTWVSSGKQFKYENNLTQLFDGKLPEEGKPGQTRVPIGKEFSIHAYNGEVLCTHSPSKNKVTIRNLEDSPIGNLNQSIKQRPLFPGLSIMGLSLRDIVSGKSWYKRPEDRGLTTKRIVRCAGTRNYKGSEVHIIEMIASWIEVNGFPKTRRYEILVDTAKGFTIPFTSVEYDFKGVHSKFDTTETECIEYNDGLWGPKKTVRTLLLITEKGEGKSVTTINIERMEFNKSIEERELRIALDDKPSVECQITGLNNLCRQESIDNMLIQINKALCEKGFRNPLPIVKKIQKENTDSQKY